MEGLDEVAHYGKTYDLKFKLVDNEAISTSISLECEKIYKDTSDLKLGGTNVRVTTETEYVCKDLDNNHGTLGTTTMVKGMDNATTKGLDSTIEFSVHTSKAGAYKLNYECANLNILSGSDGYYSLDTKMSDVLEVLVNGQSVDVSSVVIKGHTTPSKQSTAASALARCFQVVDLGDVQLKKGANTIVLKGKTDCSLRNVYSEIPVPNTKSFSMTYNG